MYRSDRRGKNNNTNLDEKFARSHDYERTSCGVTSSKIKCVDMYSRVSRATLFRCARKSHMPIRNMASTPKKSSPYDIPHGKAYPSEAYAFGRGPNAKNEGWEGITWACYIGCFLWITVGLSVKDDDSFQVSAIV